MYNIPNIGDIPKIGDIPNIGNISNIINKLNIGNIPNIRNIENIQNIENNSDKESYYNILGISPNSSYEEIKKAYRKLSLDNHPDRNNDNKEKCEKFKKITTAYKILNSESDRKEYDNTLNNNLITKDNNIINTISNIINSINYESFIKNCVNSESIIFDNNISSNKTLKPKCIHKNINITFLEAFNGCKIPIDIKRWILELDIKYEEIETIYVDIFQGIDNNEIITLENKGNIISDTNKGDVKIKVLVNNNTLFERKGIDLIFKKSITLKESLCGFNFNLTHIDGRIFKINNESGNIIPPNFKKIIKNLGITRDKDIGNLIIEFNINYPKQLTDKQIKEIENIL